MSSDSEYDTDSVSVDYESFAKEERTTETVIVPASKSNLKQAVSLGSEEEWLEWLRSDAVKPFWVELWESFLRDQAPGERGPILIAVQRRILLGEVHGKRKYSRLFKAKDDWDELDHHACFHYWVASENTRGCDGVFWEKNMPENEIDAIVWGLKHYLTHIHSPSQIEKPGGGTSVFGASRTAPEDPSGTHPEFSEYSVT